MRETRLRKRKVEGDTEVFTDKTNFSRTKDEPTTKIQRQEKKNPVEFQKLHLSKPREFFNDVDENVEPVDKGSLKQDAKQSKVHLISQHSKKKIDNSKTRKEPKAGRNVAIHNTAHIGENVKGLLKSTKIKNNTPVKSGPVCHDYTLSSCFGFSDSDDDIKPRSIFKSLLDKFDPSKPYRAALYIPLFIRRKPMNVSFNNVANSTEVSISNKTLVINSSSSSNDASNLGVDTSCQKTKGRGKSKPVKVKNTKSKLVQKKLTDMVLSKPETRTCNKEVKYKSFFNDSAQFNSTFEDDPDMCVNAKPSRKSYERKLTLKEPQEEEPSTDQVEMQLQRQKTTKGKPRRKRTQKEEKEYENWAKSINSEFDDIDKFELTVLED